MSDEPQNGSAPPIDLDLRTRNYTGPLTPDMKRFDIFLIDTGWNRPISKLVREQLPLIYEYQRQDSLYLLTPEQSIEILRRDPDWIGHDPTIVVYDLFGSSQSNARGYKGFRLNLGLIRQPRQALVRLQEFIRFVAANRTAHCLEREVLRELHREGAEGMIKLLRETTTELIAE